MKTNESHNSQRANMNSVKAMRNSPALNFPPYLTFPRAVRGGQAVVPTSSARKQVSDSRPNSRIYPLLNQHRNKPL
jgi:hypothetical protein